MDKNSRILITGGSGFLGKALVQELRNHYYNNIIPLCSANADLIDIHHTEHMFLTYKPDVVIHLAAKVGGIGANMENPGRFFYDNMMMGLNVIEMSRLYNVKKFVQIGTVCSYPKYTPVPFQEKDIWIGYPEETNAPYGIAKKALLVMLQAYRKQYDFNGIYLIPVNLYGPGDNFNLASSHVIPALIKKIALAKAIKASSISIWGTGRASREFLYVADCARGIRLAMEQYNEAEPINLGSGQEVTIASLVNILCRLMDYHGDVIYDSSKPDGQPRRCLDISKAVTKFGFKVETSLEGGLLETIEYFYQKAEKDANAAYTQCRA